MSEYRIWFKADGYKEIELPVNPQEITITYAGNTSNYDVEGIGEIIVPRLPKLATVTFESFFPRERTWVSMVNSDSWYPPDWYISFFRTIQKSRQPFELTIARGYDLLNEIGSDGSITSSRTDYFDTVFSKAVILDISTTDKGGEPGDVYYTMSVSEYRDASPKTLAELAEEETDANGEVIAQKMVMSVNRPPQNGFIAVGRSIQINGKVYNVPDEVAQGWQKAKKKANQVKAVVSRVLPPEVSNKLHSIYVSGLGWVSKGDCKLMEQANLVSGIETIVTNK